MSSKHVFDLSQATDVAAFTEFSESFFDLIDAAYAEDALPREFHSERVHKQEHVLFLLSEMRKVVAAASMRPDGKVSALGVSPSFRRRGCGTKLIRLCSRRFKTLFVEVRARNTRMLSFAARTGFRPVPQIGRIRELLGADAALLKDYNLTNDGRIVYARRSRNFPGVEHKFLMMELRHQYPT